MKNRYPLLIALVLLVPAVVSANDSRLRPPDGATELGTPATKLKVEIDKSKVDLPGHKLEVKATHQVAKVTIKVITESGAVLAQEEQPMGPNTPGIPLQVTWSPSSDEAAARIEVIVYDTDGYWSGVAIIPWAVSVPHEEVRFRTDSAAIDDSEKPKLEASFTKLNEIVAKHKDIGTITLFIAGHTDTVGAADYNLRLSQRRAQAIAAWFRVRGLRIPVAYEGFGETSLAVKTADEVDEPKNRRVDYILSVEEPAFKTTGFRPAWKRVN